MHVCTCRQAGRQMCKQAGRQTDRRMHAYLEDDELEVHGQEEAGGDARDEEDVVEREIVGFPVWAGCLVWGMGGVSGRG